MAEVVKGILERVIFRNEENFFSILELRSINKTASSFTACGKVPGINCGETVTLQGDWINHPKFGRQFSIESFSSELPADVVGIRKYLSSGLIPGIGKIYGNKIVDYFGTDTFDIISTESARLQEVPGIGNTRAKKIKAAWDEQCAIRDILIFLQTYDISNALCLRLYKIYGNSAKQILLTDPYRVSREVDGIGFKTADKIAQSIGIPSNHDSRIDAGIFFCFSNIESQGHTCYPREEIIKQTQQLLEIARDKIEFRINILIKFEKINEISEGILQLNLFKFHEVAIFENLQRLKNAHSILPPIQVDNAIEWAQKREGFVFAEEQILALRRALTGKLSILTGGPGTGKTTILRSLVSILSAKNVRIGIAAPTGRAAQKLTETTHIEAKTIHRLLQFNPQTKKFSSNQDEPLEFDYIIIDEVSMLDTSLAHSLLDASPTFAHVLLVGDSDQLPSVGAGNILADFIGSGFFSVTKLQQIFRQGEHSEIVQLAHKIISGNDDVPPLTEDCSSINAEHDFYFILAQSPEDCAKKIEELHRNTLPDLFAIDPLKDVQVLAPLHRGSIGIETLNNQLQNIFSENGKQIPWTRFRLGDKVIQLRNNYEKNIFNGDLGTIYNFDTENLSVFVNFNGEAVELSRAEIGDLTLAYAISIHKSQGSEFPIVIIPLMTQHYIMLQRNLLYTAVTRGRNKVFIVGDPKAFSLAIKNKKNVVRMTGLPYLFRNLPQETKTPV